MGRLAWLPHFGNAGGIIAGEIRNKGRQAKVKKNDTHLHSTLASKRLSPSRPLMASPASISDFQVDEESWAIHELVIKVGHRFTGSEVLIPVKLRASVSVIRNPR